MKCSGSVAPPPLLLLRLSLEDGDGLEGSGQLCVKRRDCGGWGGVGWNGCALRCLPNSAVSKSRVGGERAGYGGPLAVLGTDAGFRSASVDLRFASVRGTGGASPCCTLSWSSG